MSGSSLVLSFLVCQMVSKESPLDRECLSQMLTLEHLTLLYLENVCVPREQEEGGAGVAGRCESLKWNSVFWKSCNY